MGTVLLAAPPRPWGPSVSGHRRQAPSARAARPIHSCFSADSIADIHGLRKVLLKSYGPAAPCPGFADYF